MNAKDPHPAVALLKISAQLSSLPEDRRDAAQAALLKSWRMIKGLLIGEKDGDGGPREKEKIRGEKSKNAKLTEEAVRRIFERATNGERYREIRREFGVSLSLIHGIVHGYRWAHLGLCNGKGKPAERQIHLPITLDGTQNGQNGN